MDDSLPRKLLRATRLGRPVSLAPAALANVTSTIQRTLDSALSGLPGSGRMGQGSGLLAKLNLATTGRNTASSVPSGAVFLSGTYAEAAGSRPYRLYVPSRRDPHPPLIVMLHGCTQDAADFAAGTRMNSLAEEAGALVLYPVQVSGANAQRCWNWFSPADQSAGQGEPAIIAGMTRHVMAEYQADSDRVFVAGLSAGGAAAAILGSTYPELFAAIGVHSGLACGAASDMMSAFSAMRQGRPGRGHIGVPAIIFHGDRDSTVNPDNADAVAAQVAQPGTRRTEQGQAPGGLAWTRRVQAGADGRPLLEQWTVHGAGHAWSGGSADGSYTEPRGPDASREMLRFFQEVRPRAA